MGNRVDGHGGAKEAQEARYLDVTYRNHEYTSYPSLLTGYLCGALDLRPGKTLLDVGSGRGEFAQGFREQGLNVVEVDQSPLPDGSSPRDYSVVDLEKELPFEDSTYDVVFNKSVIEHFYHPESLVQEMHRVLTPGGIIISLTPSWVHNVKNFHIDFTHRTPFTRESLGDIHRIAGFENVRSEYFIQLPKVWRFHFLRHGTALLRVVAPTGLSKYSKTIRFSKEVMLIATATKPLD